MKKIHIVLILGVAIVAAILVSTYTTAMDNTTFDQAKVQPGKKVKITGTLDKTASVQYDESIDPDLTVFTVLDANGNREVVHLHDKQGKPMGLDQSESVTVEGKYNEAGEFHASYIQMKCPSKYNDEKHSLSSEAQ